MTACLKIWILLLCCNSAGAQVLQGDTIQVVKYGPADNESYSLVLPESYTAAKQYPVIIFLDPAGRGEFPVKKYSSIASDQEVILAGSFGSRNFDPVSSARSIAGIYDDLRRTITIDTNKVWLAGFSGGARMATSFAQTYSEIKGVIACGAGFSQLPGQDGINYSFVGIVGDGDMNYEEMLGINEDFTKSGNENLLLINNGGHQWPGVEEMALAVCWLSRENCSTKIIDRTKFLMMGWARGLDPDTGLLYPYWLRAREIKKITPLFLIADSIQQTIEAKKSFKQDKKDFILTIEDERKYMDDLTLLFNKSINMAGLEIDNNAWKQKAGLLKKLQRNKRNYFSERRRLDFCWRLCIEQYSYFMSTRNFRKAFKAASIMCFFDVPGIDPRLYVARAAAALKDEKR